MGRTPAVIDAYERITGSSKYQKEAAITAGF